MLCVLSGLLYLKLRPQLFPRIVQHILVTTKACMESAQYKALISIAALLCRAYFVVQTAGTVCIQKAQRPCPCGFSTAVHDELQPTCTSDVAVLLQPIDD